MRKLRIALMVLAGLWLVAELASIPVAERAIERRVAERNRDVATVQADIDSFPLVSRLLLTGGVREVTITLDRVVRQNLTFAEVRFELAGIEVDRAAILRQDARITAIERGTVTATIDVDALSAALGRIVSLAGADVRVRGRALVIGPASVQITSDLLPCDPEARADGEQVIVSCTIHEVPQALLAATQRG